MQNHWVNSESEESCPWNHVFNILESRLDLLYQSLRVHIGIKINNESISQILLPESPQQDYQQMEQRECEYAQQFAQASPSASIDYRTDDERQWVPEDSGLKLLSNSLQPNFHQDYCPNWIRDPSLHVPHADLDSNYDQGRQCSSFFPQPNRRFSVHHSVLDD
jgi:hypothetical protein